MPDTYEEVPLSPDEMKALGIAPAMEEVPMTADEAKAAGIPLPPPPEGVDPGRWKTALHSFLAGTFKQGSDEAIGAITRAAVKPGDGAAWRRPDGSTMPLNTPEDVYRASRDTERTMLEEGRKAHPGLAFAGNLAGDVVGDAILAQFGVPVASVPYQVGAGALSGLLGSNADLTSEKRMPSDVLNAAGSTALGGATAYVAPKIGQAVGRYAAPVLRKVRSGLESVAEGMGRRVLQGGSDLASATRKEIPGDVILEAIRSGGILPFGTTQGAFKRLERLASQRGDAYAALLADLEDAGFHGPDVPKLANELMQRAAESFETSGSNKVVANTFAGEAKSLEDLARGASFNAPEMVGPMRPDIPLTQAEGIKRTLQDQARWGLISDTPMNEAKKEVASRMRQAIEDAVTEQGLQHPDTSIERVLADSFVPAKQQLGRTLAARDLAEKGTARIAGRNAVGLRESMMGAMMSGGDPATALLGAAGLSLAKSRLPSAGASMAYWLGQGAKQGAETASRYAPQLTTAGSKAAAYLARQPTAQQALTDWLTADPRKAQLQALMDYLQKTKDDNR